MVKVRSPNSNKNTVKQTTENGKISFKSRVAKTLPVFLHWSQEFEAACRMFLSSTGRIGFTTTDILKCFRLIVNISNCSRDLRYLQGGSNDSTNTQTCNFSLSVDCLAIRSLTRTFTFGFCRKKSISSKLVYRIMYGLTVCFNWMIEARSRGYSVRIEQPWPASTLSDITHTPRANRCSGCSHTCTWKRTKVLVDNYNAALRGQVQVLVPLINNQAWLGWNWPANVARATFYIKTQGFPARNASGRASTALRRIQQLYQRAGIGVHKFHALAPVVLLRMPSCILSIIPRSLSTCR